MRLIQGDCLTVLHDLIAEGVQVDMAFTSPPYNRKKNDKYENYEDVLDDYFSFLVSFTDSLLQMTRRHVIVNVQATFYNKIDVYRYIGHYSEKIQQIIIWEKSNPQPSSHGSVTNAYEYFFVLGDVPLKTNKGQFIKNHITTAVNSNMSKIHKAVMKPEVAQWFFDNFMCPGDVVIDPFMGLGTTGLACMQSDCDFIGIELDETYFQIAQDRINGSNTELPQKQSKEFDEDDPLSFFF